MLMPRINPEGRIDEPEIDRLDDGQCATRCAELFHCVLDVKIDRVFADTQNNRDVPGRLPGGGPSKAFLFAIRQPHGTSLDWDVQTNLVCNRVTYIQVCVNFLFKAGLILLFSLRTMSLSSHSPLPPFGTA